MRVRTIWPDQSTSIGHTIIARKTVNRGIEELRDGLSRGLRTQSWPVRVVVHERDLLRRLVRRVEVVLRKVYISSDCPKHMLKKPTSAKMKLSRSMNFSGPP